MQAQVPQRSLREQWAAETSVVVKVGMPGIEHLPDWGDHESALLHCDIGKAACENLS